MTARSPGSNAGRTELCREGQLPLWNRGTSVCQTAFFEVGSNSKSAFQKKYSDHGSGRVLQRMQRWRNSSRVANRLTSACMFVHKCGACTRAQFATVLQLQAAVGVSLAAHGTAWGTPPVNLGPDASHRSRFKPLLCGCASHQHHFVAITIPKR